MNARQSLLFGGFTRYFFIGGLCLMGLFAYVAFWSILAQWSTGDNSWGVGTATELLMALRGGGLIVVLTLSGAVWLLVTGFANRGAELRQRDRRIAELEARLAGTSADYRPAL